MDFEAAFDRIAAPEKQHGTPLYSVTSIEGLKSYLVGKDRDALACVLVATTDNTRTVQAPIRLETIEVQFDLHCQIRKGQEPAREDVFTVIRCRSVDRETVRYFLSVCETLISMVGDQPRRSGVASAVNRLVAIFRRAQAVPRRTINGLFGELYVISRSRNPAKALAAWRIDETARFDFTCGDGRLDVKVSGGRVRAHSFSYDQCNPPPGTVGVIASLFAERVASGTSLQNLIARIEHQLAGDVDPILKLREVVVTTLGNSLREGLSTAFDMRLADSSLHFYHASEIPAVRGPLPPGVSDVHFTADLSSLKTTALQDLIQQNADLRELLPGSVAGV